MDIEFHIFMNSFDGQKKLVKKMNKIEEDVL